MGCCCSQNTSANEIPEVRAPIPKKMRDEVWIKYQGTSEYGQCYSCGYSVQRYNGGWHCSHVVADSKGGPTTLRNLRVCCRHCNLSMGDQNLYVYILGKSLKGPGSKNAAKYLRLHPKQISDTRTNNWGRSG